jgi:type VI protein secretion system component VasK
MLHNSCCAEQEEHEVEQRLGSSNRTVWDLLVVLGVLIVGAAVGFWLSEQRNAARYQEVQNQLVKLEQELQDEQRSQNVAALQAYFEQMRQLLLERPTRLRNGQRGAKTGKGADAGHSGQLGRRG